MTAMVRSDAILLQKEVYLRQKVIVDMFEEGTPLHDIIDSGTEVTSAVTSLGEIEGEFMTLMQRLSGPPNAAVGFAEGDGHARSGFSTYRKGKYLIARQNQSFGISGLTKMTTGGGVSSVDDILSLEADAQISAARKKMSQHMNGTADGLIDTVSTSNKWNNGTKVLTVPDGTKFAKGQEIICRGKQAGGLSTGTLHASWPQTNGMNTPMLIDSISTNDLTIKTHTGGVFVEPDIDAFDSAGIYAYDAQHKNLWGLGDICSDANSQASGYAPGDPTTLLTTEQLLVKGMIGGIDRSDAANADWKATVYTAATLGGTTNPSIRSHVKPLLNIIQKRTGGAHNWLLGLTGLDVWTAFEEELIRDQRTGYKVKLKAGGHEAIVIDDLYIVVDQDAVYTELKVFEPDSMFRVIPEAWHIDTTTGSWNREYNALGRGKNEFTAYWITSQQMLIARMLPMAKITTFNTAR